MLLERVRGLQLHRQKKVQVLAAVFFVLFALLLFRLLLPNAVYHYEGSRVFSEGDAQGETVIFNDIALGPGVYCVELEFSADTDLSGVCTMKDGTVIRGGLLTNGEPLYAGNTKTGFHMWLYEATEHMQAVISYGGKGQITTGALTIRETNLLWTRMMVLLLAIMAVTAAVVVYRAYDRKYGVAVNKKQRFFMLVLIGLFASLPCLCRSVLSGADLTYHLQRIEGCRDGILSGQFPVRLEPAWLYGHGYANAIFYCPALLYLPALFRLAGFTVTSAYNIFCLFLGLATAWISWYAFSKILKNDQIGIVCSALYTLSVFRMYKLFMFGAVGEGSAYTFLPLVLLGLYRIFCEDPEEKNYKTAWLQIAFGYAGLIQTHVLTCEITAFVTAAICLVYIRRLFCKNTFIGLVKGAAGALGLSLWYLVPFLDYYMTQDVHIRHVSARTIQDRGLQLVNLLTGLQDGNFHNFNLGFILLPGICVFAVLLAGGRLRGKRDVPLKFAVVCAGLGIILPVMSLAVFPWDAIQGWNSVSASLVSSLQFPNRFLGWGTAFLVAAAGYVLRYLQDRGRGRLYRAGIVILTGGALVTASYHFDFAIAQQQAFRIYNEEAMGFGYISGAEYLIQGTDAGRLTFCGAKPGAGVKIDAYDKNYLRIDMDCTNEGAGEAYVDLPLLHYKGYHAYETDTGGELKIGYGDNHVVRVMLPEGFSGGVKVRFISPFYWRLAEAVSIATTAVIMIMLWEKTLRGKRNRRKV